MTNAKVSTSNPNCISIQNFKAFGEKVDVPIRPITLIFGENSAGKSSILHSILFLNQLQYQPQASLADVTYTKAGGNSVDLGGLSKLIYGHENANELSFEIESFNTSHQSDRHKIDENDDTSNYSSSFRYNFSSNDRSNTIVFNYDNLSTFILNYSQQDSTSQIDLDVSVDALIDALKNSIFKVEITSRMRIQYLYSRISDSNAANLNKNSLKSLSNTYVDAMVDYLKIYRSSNTTLRFTIQFNSTYSNIFETLKEKYGYRPLRCRILSSDNIKFVKKNLLKTDAFPISIEYLLFVIWQSICSRYRKIAETFNNISYLGPIRTIPTRNFDTLDSIARDPSTGSSSWERLASDQKTRLDTNTWLQKFGTNKEIRTERLIESAQIRKLLSNKVTVNQILKDIDSGQLSSRHMLRFYDTQKDLVLSHRDMGVGISQVLPVIVNCVANTNTTVLIEQPELHLHPRLQGDVADLLIDTAIKGEQKNTYLIETHSEHIIRRIMRRIREDQHKPAGDKRITKDDVAILYVANGPHGSTVTQLRLDDEGDLIDEWPNGFFEEGFRDDMAGR